jgi:hypothetical protein
LVTFAYGFFIEEANAFFSHKGSKTQRKQKLNYKRGCVLTAMLVFIDEFLLKMSNKTLEFTSGTFKFLT